MSPRVFAFIFLVDRSAVQRWFAERSTTILVRTLLRAGFSFRFLSLPRWLAAKLQVPAGRTMKCGVWAIVFVVLLALQSSFGLLRAVEPTPLSTFSVDPTVVEGLADSTDDLEPPESSTQENATEDPRPKDQQKDADRSAGQAESEEPDFPDLSVPPGADRQKLEQIVARAKTARPKSVEQYQAQQVAIREASTRLLEILPAEDPAFAQTEMDSIIASVSLMAFFGDDEQEDILDQLVELFNSRDTLSMQDVQTGLLAAGMIELQPDKQPAIELYELLDQKLEGDSREEMQSMRLNLQASIRRLNLLGNRLELSATTIDGKKITTEDFKGKFVIVDLFATWCEPCLAEAELIEAHYKKYRDRGLEVIGISLDEDKQELLEYLERRSLPWPIIHDADEDPLERFVMKFGVSALPTVLLLDKEGKVISLEARQSELNRLMQILFESPTPAADLDQVQEDTENQSDSGLVPNPIQP